MTTVFIGGSRAISRLNDTIRSRLDNIIRQQFTVLIGDANGTDKAVQSYFASQGYRNVTVYCTGNRCRNNVGGWPTKPVASDRTTKDFAYYATKDREMANAASCGFMIWDGKSRGSFSNILNLIRQEKPVLVYFAADKSCYTLKSPEDLSTLLDKVESGDRQRFEAEFSHLAAPRVAGADFPLFAADRE